MLAAEGRQGPAAPILPRGCPASMGLGFRPTVSLPVEGAGRVLVSSLFTEATGATCPRTPRSHVLTLGPDPGLSSPAMGLLPAEAPTLSLCSLLQGPKSPLTPGTASSANAYQEVRPTLCPLWALGQAASLLACEAQPFEPWFQGGCCPSPAP